MNEKEKQWINQVLADRIHMILETNQCQKPSEDMENYIVQAEWIIRDLPDSERSCIEDYVNHMFEIAATQEELMYKAGVSDGIRMMRIFDVK